MDALVVADDLGPTVATASMELITFTNVAAPLLYRYLYNRMPLPSRRPGAHRQ
jgi:hypothetical protein